MHRAIVRHENNYMHTKTVLYELLKLEVNRSDVIAIRTRCIVITFIQYNRFALIIDTVYTCTLQEKN